MQVWLGKLADFWQQKISPQLATLVTTIGIVGLTVSWVIIVILAKLSEEVWEKEAFAFDKTILLWIHHFHSPSWNKIMLLVTQLGNPSTAVLITLLTLGILVWQRYLQEAKIFLFNCLGGVILSYGLKLAFSKPRPQLWEPLIEEHSYSYPSGHALGVVVLYGFIAYLLGSHYQQYANIFYLIAVLIIAAVGFSRLYLGVHWLTDVIAGYGVGFLWVNFCIIMLELIKTKSH